MSISTILLCLALSTPSPAVEPLEPTPQVEVELSPWLDLSELVGPDDVCVDNDWYDDGICDLVCAQPDPDCSGVAPTEGEGEPVEDWCAMEGWYGDGVCDADCLQPDPDCGGTEPAEDEGEPVEDWCAMEGWYGDGICDADCPSPDPDCA